MHGFERKSNLGIEYRSQPSFIARVFPRGDMRSEHLDEQHVCQSVDDDFRTRRWFAHFACKQAETRVKSQALEALPFIGFLLSTSMSSLGPPERSHQWTLPPFG